MSNIILGIHPNNTIFSFNWHNVRFIRAFLKAECSRIDKPGIVVADIGGGGSPYYSYFADLAKEYICVDLKQALPCNEHRHIKQIEGKAENIPLDDASVDVVLCNQVLEHVIDPDMAVAEMFRILKTGGLFCGSVPHVSPVHLEPYDFRRFTDLGLVQLFESNGFVDIEVVGNGGVFSAAALMIAMDILLSVREEGKPQHFNSKLALYLAPVVVVLNITSLILDKLIRNRNRTPANLCWRAQKV